MKPHSPLLGFNNNVRHKGRVFHIQTEDSGVKHPHIITHLFADGGRILKTTKTSYAEHVGAANVSETVRHLMQEQHKGMFIALRDGQFDHLLEELPPAPPGATAANPGGSVRPAPPAVARATALTDPAPVSPAAAKAPAMPPLAPAGAGAGKKPSSRPKLELDLGTASALAQKPKTPAQAETQPRVERPVQVEPIAVVPADKRANPNAATVVATAPTETPPSDPNEVDLDLDALERAAAEAQVPFYQQINDLPPPPAAVLGKKASDVPPRDTSYRNVSTHVVEAPPPPPPATSASRGAPPVSSGRYAPPRPAAIFHNSRPAEGQSIFGEDLISEKSLDEVILSYLAEDLDAPSEKK